MNQLGLTLHRNRLSNFLIFGIPPLIIYHLSLNIFIIFVYTPTTFKFDN